ncbi:helix-turn-helix transcriptional regulator [Jeotgalibacillus sp. ET6]|uniref:helix-turn-helix domain-containing protein n=1 Tax=Jeotgalibacillus sp. ET6 TaxID=3037260 RepID=UPI0024182E15|nr:helix-turn-helix transcriptional regulator [Jeotgalibacillus sp. ET6]MDG5472612.1 helix-turn-helix transcriptional regulator [Jeotgalibacillus sp. ET6]
MIGKNIIQLRKEKGLTLSELAEKAGVSKSYLSNIERNLKHNPSIHVMEKISSVLGVELKFLLDESSSDRLSEDYKFNQFWNELKENVTTEDELKEYQLVLEFMKWRKQQKR